jgi:hypothetical protein
MKLKNILGIVVSLLTIMAGSFALVMSLSFLLDSSTYSPMTVGLAIATVALVIVGKFLLTKEQLKHTLISTLLASFLLIPVLIILLIFHYRSDWSAYEIILFFGLATIPILIIQYLEKVNWRYIFAILYISGLAIFSILTSTN